MRLGYALIKTEPCLTPNRPMAWDGTGTSSHPHAGQPLRAELGVSDGVPDVPVAEEILNEPGVQARVSEHVARAVTKHVRVDVEPYPSSLASLLHDARHHVGTKGLSGINCYI